MSLIAIRTDASSSIGTGHVSRCLTLSHQLLKHGHEVVFLMRQLAGNMISQVEHQGFRVHVLHTTMAANEELNWTQDAKACKEYLTHQSTPVGWLIVDHYQLDSRWESAINPSVKQIMVIDDLANRQHHCQILLDQNLYHHSETRYRYLLDTNTRQLLGPRYVLLREEFLQLPSLPRNYPKTVSKVIIYYGGSDPTGETLKAMEAFAGGQYKHINFSVVIGASCADYERIKARCAALSNFQFHCQINNMAEMLSQTELAVGACGSSTWERCYMGVPTLSTEIAENQSELSQVLAEQGAIINLGWYTQVNIESLRKAFDQLLQNLQTLSEMSHMAHGLLHQDGYLGASYIANLLNHIPANSELSHG